MYNYTTVFIILFLFCSSAILPQKTFCQEVHIDRGKIELLNAIQGQDSVTLVLPQFVASNNNLSLKLYQNIQISSNQTALYCPNYSTNDTPLPFLPATFGQDKLNGIVWGKHIENNPNDNGGKLQPLAFSAKITPNGTLTITAKKLPQGSCLFSNEQMWVVSCEIWIGSILLQTIQYTLISSDKLSLNQVQGKTQTESMPNMVAYPQPFKDQTTLYCEVRESTLLSLTIYDTHGKVVAAPIKQIPITSGFCEYTWDASNVPANVYYAVWQTKQGTLKQKILKIQ